MINLLSFQTNMQSELISKPLTPVLDLSFGFFDSLYYWFNKNQRNLPWRKNRTPYRVWIAEVMLQQTQSQTVSRYYLQWMKKFPTLKSLYQYSNRENQENEIIALWQGLGYYRRALNILRTAEKIRKEYKGKFPNSRENLLKLPGIGHYTASAIMNFGFQTNNPPSMVDGNFIRVFSRLFYLSSRQVSNKKTIWTIANAFLQHPSNTKPRIFNEAIMEVGALICNRDNPLCMNCPLQKDCIAFKKSKSNHSPFTVSKKLIPVHSTAVVIITIVDKQKKFLLMKGKTQKSLSKKSLSKKKENPLNFLWRFPTVDRHSSFDLSTNPKSHLSQLMSNHLGLSVKNPRFHFLIYHHYTKYRVALRVWEEVWNTFRSTQVIPLPSKKDNLWKWVSSYELSNIGLSSSDQKIRKYFLNKEKHSL